MTLSNATTYTDYNIFVFMVYGEEVPVSQFLEHKVKQNVREIYEQVVSSRICPNLGQRIPATAVCVAKVF